VPGPPRPYGMTAEALVLTFRMAVVASAVVAPAVQLAGLFDTDILTNGRAAGSRSLATRAFLPTLARNW